MNGNYPMFLDAELARLTKVSQIVLFVLGTLLMPCGLVVAYLGLLYMEMGGMRGLGGDDLANPVYCALAGTGSGVLAWVMLGLLFFKRADPRWHVVVWPSLILFSLVAGFGCFVWLGRESMADVVWIAAVLWTVVIASVLCLVIGCRNLGLAFESRRRLKAGLEAFLIQYGPAAPINPPN